MRPPLTEEDIEAPNPMDKAYGKNKMTCDWWAKGMKGLTRFKAEDGQKDDKGKMQKLSTAPAGRIRKDAFELVAEVAGWKKEKVEHSGTIVFESNVPEPDPLPEEEET